MTFTAVLMICVAAIVACTTLVFLVETIVAFWLHDTAQAKAPVFHPVSLQTYARDRRHDRAA